MRLLRRLFGMHKPALTMDEVIREVRIMRPGPDDIVVLKTQRALRPEMAEHVRRIWAQALPGIKALCLDEGMDIELVRSGAHPHVAPQARQA